MTTTRRDATRWWAPRGPARALVALLASALLASGCGDGTEDAADSDDPTTDTTDTAASAEVTTTTSEPGPRTSAACGGAGHDPVVEEERTLLVDGVDRRYLVTVPGDHDGRTPLPVVFDFHGLMEGAEIHATMSQYSAVAEDEGFVAVFPHGTDDPVRWNVDVGGAPNPDIAYFDAVLDEVASTLCVDESRVYATGLSNGAMFTSALLCERADVLAAAAPVAGLQDPEPCRQSRPVPIVAFHGTADPILLFNGGVDVSAIPGFEDESTETTVRPPVDLDGEGYPAHVAAFAERNGCDPEPTDEEISEEVVHRVYDCPEGADVEFHIVVGGGHSWPSSEFSVAIADAVGHTTFDVDATRDGWDFMSRFRTS